MSTLPPAPMPTSPPPFQPNSHNAIFKIPINFCDPAANTY